MIKSKINSIKTKLFIVSILFLTIPLIVLGIFSYQKSESSLNELGASNLKTSVKMTIEMIDALDEEVKKGNISLEDAQEKVKVAVLGEMISEGNRPINKMKVMLLHTQQLKAITLGMQQTQMESNQRSKILKQQMKVEDLLIFLGQCQMMKV